MTKADEMKSLAKDIVAARKDRKKWNSELVTSGKKEQKERVKESKEKAVEVAGMIAGFKKDDLTRTEENKEKAAEVAGMIEGFKKDDLTRTEENKNKILEAVELIQGFTGESKERAAEIAGMIGQFKKEREDAASAWKGLLTKMSAKEKKVSIPEAIKTKEKEVSIPEALQPKKRELSIEEKVLEFIEKHPEGVRVGEMEKSLGVLRMMLGRIAKKLLEEGKVRKEENLYFPL